MAEARSRTKLPLGQPEKGPAKDEFVAFQQGIELGRQYAGEALRRAAAWAEESPGRFLLAGLAAGFVLGKLFFRPRRVRLPDLDLD